MEERNSKNLGLTLLNETYITAGDKLIGRSASLSYGLPVGLSFTFFNETKKESLFDED